MPAFVAEPFQQRALLELVLLALACGPLGVWLVAYRQAYAAESVAHALLPGLVLAVLAGAPLLLGAVGGALVAAGAIALASRDERIGPEIGIAVAVTTLFGLGSVLAVVPDVPARLQEVLFGDLLGTTDGDLLTAATVAVIALAGLAVLHRRLALAAFDPATSPTLGARPVVARLAVLALLALAAAAAVRGLGNLLVLALLLAPGAAAFNFCRRLSAALVLAAVLGVAAGVAGLALSHYAGLAAGASVALCAVAPFVVSLMPKVSANASVP